MLDLDDERLDDLVPLSIVVAFVQEFVKAYWERLQAVGALDVGATYGERRG